MEEKTKLKNVSIANALQLEAARATPVKSKEALPSPILTLYTTGTCEAKKLHRFIFAIALSELHDNFWHTYTSVNFLSHVYSIFFILSETGRQLHEF